MRTVLIMALVIIVSAALFAQLKPDAFHGLFLLLLLFLFHPHHMGMP